MTRILVTVLAGGVLAHMISRIIWDGARDLKELVKESIEALQDGFGREYRQAAEVRDGLNMALRLSASHNVSCVEAREHLRCTTVPSSCTSSALRLQPKEPNRGILPKLYKW